MREDILSQLNMAGHDDDYVMPTSNDEFHDFFDFDAASSGIMAQASEDRLSVRTPTLQTETATSIMPLTEPEIQTILAMRAAKTQGTYEVYNQALSGCDAYSSGPDTAGISGLDFVSSNAVMTDPASSADLDTLEVDVVRPSREPERPTFQATPRVLEVSGIEALDNANHSG